VFANDVLVSSTDVTSVDVIPSGGSGVPYSGFVSDPFIPKSSDVTVALKYYCTGAQPTSYSNLLVDDVSLVKL
jgi:hypothetical protein